MQADYIDIFLGFFHYFFDTNANKQAFYASMMEQGEESAQQCTTTTKMIKKKCKTLSLSLSLSRAPPPPLFFSQPPTTHVRVYMHCIRLEKNN
jgi:hypothetical protein